MSEKKNCYSILILMAGYLFMHTATASYSGDRLTVNDLVKQEQKVAINADTTLQDAKTALLQARHVLLEDRNIPDVPDSEVNRLKQLVNDAALNLQRAAEIAGRIERLQSQV